MFHADALDLIQRAGGQMTFLIERFELTNKKTLIIIVLSEDRILVL